VVCLIALGSDKIVHMREKGKLTKGLNMTRIQKEVVKLGPMTAKRRALLFF